MQINNKLEFKWKHKVVKKHTFRSSLTMIMKNKSNEICDMTCIDSTVLWLCLVNIRVISNPSLTERLDALLFRWRYLANARMTNFEMLIAIPSLTECFVAFGAYIWLFARMNTWMVFQSIGAIKTLAALYTSITTLAAMDQAMLVVNRSGKKTFVAN